MTEAMVCLWLVLAVGTYFALGKDCERPVYKWEIKDRRKKDRRKKEGNGG